jgi:N-acetyl-gamma-glutamylphosphate reductase
MSIRVGIIGIRGLGGREAMRLVASHPPVELTYAVGEASAGSRLIATLEKLREMPLADATTTVLDIIVDEIAQALRLPAK